MKRQRIAYLLTCLSEECAELAKEVSKALRFGPHDSYEGTTPLQRLNTEFSDLMAIRIELEEAGLVVGVNLKAITAKRARLKKAMLYSRKVGLIKP